MNTNLVKQQIDSLYAQLDACASGINVLNAAIFGTTGGTSPTTGRAQQGNVPSGSWSGTPRNVSGSTRRRTHRRTRAANVNT